MQKFTRFGGLLACTLLVACAAKPAETSNAQWYFDNACKFAMPVVETAWPLAPTYTKRLTTDQQLAVNSGLSAIAAICGTPLDLKNAAQITQRVYDIAGQIIEMVIKAQSLPPVG